MTSIFSYELIVTTISKYLNLKENIRFSSINRELYFSYVSAAAYHRKWVMREVNSRLKCVNPEWTYFSGGQEWR